MIGGLVVSTMLSLIFVPAFFTILDDFGRLTWWAFSKLVGRIDEREVTPDEEPEVAPAPPRPRPKEIAAAAE